MTKILLTAAIGGLVLYGTSLGSAAGQSTTVWDGVYTEAQAARGGALYLQHCSQCHGVELEGLDEAAPLKGGIFMSNWNGLTLGDLLERVRMTMPLDDPDRLGRDEKVDVLAYVLSVNNFPAGATELPIRTEQLAVILIDAYRQ